MAPSQGQSIRGKRAKRRSPSARRRRRRPRWMQTTAAHSHSPSKRCHIAGTRRALLPRCRAPLCPGPSLFAVGRRRDNLSEPSIGRRRHRISPIEAAEWTRTDHAAIRSARTHIALAPTSHPRYPAVLRAFAIRSARPFPPPPTPNHGGSVRYVRVTRWRYFSLLHWCGCPPVVHGVRVLCVVVRRRMPMVERIPAVRAPCGPG